LDLAVHLSRHPRHVALVSLVAGLLLSARPGWALAAGAAAVPLLGISTQRLALALTAGVLVLGGASIGAARRNAIDSSELGPFAGHAVAAEAFLVKRERPAAGEYRSRMRVTGLALGARPQALHEVDDLVQVRAEAKALQRPLGIGEQARLRGVLTELPDRPGARFDYAGYLRRSGVHALLRAESIVPTRSRRSGPAGMVDLLRRRAEVGVGAGLEPRLGALARGVVLGQDERIPAKMVDQFKASGLAHLLAVSGQNVALLSVLALPVLAALGLGRRARLLAVLALIALYVPLTGAGPSILRAGAMGAAATLALLAGRPASRWYGLLLASAFTLTLDPRAWLDVGWQLSFAAVVGILFLVPALRRPLRRLPRPLAEGTAVTVAATVVTAPLMAFHFERVSIVSLLSNLVALPVVAPIMWIGMLAGAAAQVSVAAATLLNGLNGFCLAYLAAVAGWSAGLPSAVVSVSLGSPPALFAAYALLAIGLIAAARAIRWSRSCFPGRRPLAVALAALALVIVTAWVLRSPGAPGPPVSFTVSFLDVGQGDATLLQAPGGETALIDGGPAQPDSDLVEKLRESGARSLDLVVLTHAQADHEGGLEAVLRELPVSLLLNGGQGARARAHRRIVALARQRGVRVISGRAGETLRVGAMRLRVLSPERGLSTPAEEPNDRAIVLVATYAGLDVFLPADAESNVTLGLPLRPVEVLKVAHHGSEDEGLRSLLGRLEPEIAVIEVGERNRYGHPHRRTLAALESSVPTVLRTDRRGDVKVTLGRDGPSVSTEH
jgi:competence protein ComEC